MPRIAAALLLIVMVATGPRAVEPAAPGAIAVVVGAASPVRDVTIDRLRELYLRRQRLWTDGNGAVPVNLPADSAIRRAFSERVLGRMPDDLVGYWNRRYFEGVRPPLVLQSPAAVCAYVAVEPYAIGYLPLAEVNGAACRVLLVIGRAP